MRTLLRAVGAFVVAWGTLLLSAPGASALSCVAPSDFFPGADHVFVGRIADVQGERMRFEVEEVWQGDDLPRDLWVRIGIEEWFPFSEKGEVPEGYSSPTQYVVATGADLVVTPCSLAPDDGSDYGVDDGLPRPPVWDAATSGVAGEGPAQSPEAQAEPREGAADEAGSTSVAPLVAGGAGVAGVAAALTALWWRRSG
ncbi:MAG TPA: hypothetical protein VLB29_19260 [Nocardioidaceae bacterium]|nr:hypothetical protein [Nocardioidaceae bacterium]